ncbi:hypothetical protein DFH94DRAFT_848018 [Russula ochroleuca]|uniref:Uncharacterized protein n=1 Tax=Russula ochroleuca TaxID=152965 RepID=A0A9P5MQD5_9AGAM|nr:hypothetical protein DFH94DRAFT_848018 [Russula ochroleuca]
MTYEDERSVTGGGKGAGRRQERKGPGGQRKSNRGRRRGRLKLRTRASVKADRRRSTEGKDDEAARDHQPPDFVLGLHYTVLYLHLSVKLEWYPPTTSVPGTKNCSDVSLDNAAAPIPLNHCEWQTIAFPKSTSNELTISAGLVLRCPQTDTTLLALPYFPSGKIPHAILGTTGGSRLASTPVRLTTGHASFVSYTAYFPLDKLTYYPDSGMRCQSSNCFPRHSTFNTANASPRPGPPTIPQSPRPRPLPVNTLRHQRMRQGISKFPGSNRAMLQVKRRVIRPRMKARGIYLHRPTPLLTLIDNPSVFSSDCRCTIPAQLIHERPSYNAWYSKHALEKMQLRRAEARSKNGCAAEHKNSQEPPLGQSLE